MVIASALIAFAVPGFAEMVDTEQLKVLCTEKKQADKCFELGEKYRVVEMDNKSALEYFILGCDLDDMTSCVHAGILTQQKATVNTPEWKQAGDFYKKACDQHHDRGCFNLGSLKYKEGRSKQAVEFYKTACDYGNRTACENFKLLQK